MKRFLVSESLSAGAHLRLSPEESRHVTRVMRLVPGDCVLLTDGKGQEAEARLLRADKSGALMEVLGVRRAEARPFRLELLQATLKGPRMDWLVEKATELGVDSLCVVDSDFAVAGARAARWARVAQAAIKQSGSPRLPGIREAAGLGEALSSLEDGFHGFLLSPTASVGLADAVRAALPTGRGTVVLAVGPEGGFSPDEERELRARGFRACRLSAQILRGETAALVAAAVALHALEFSASPGL